MTVTPKKTLVTTTRRTERANQRKHRRDFSLIQWILVTILISSSSPSTSTSSLLIHAFTVGPHQIQSHSRHNSRHHSSLLSSLSQIPEQSSSLFSNSAISSSSHHVSQRSRRGRTATRIRQRIVTTSSRRRISDDVRLLLQQHHSIETERDGTSMISTTSHQKESTDEKIATTTEELATQCTNSTVQHNDNVGSAVATSEVISNHVNPIISNNVTSESQPISLASFIQQDDDNTAESGSSLSSTSFWSSYTSMIEKVTTSSRAFKNQKLTPEMMDRCKEFLLTKPRDDDMVVDITTISNEDNDQWKILEEQFKYHYNFTDKEYTFISRCLYYVGDECARKQSEDQRQSINNITDTSTTDINSHSRYETAVNILIAWSKLKHMGLRPREHVLSTYMYIMLNSLEKNQQHSKNIQDNNNSNYNGNDKSVPMATTTRIIADTMVDVISWHDRLYDPNEKFTFLKVKSLLFKGDVDGAEEVFASLISDTSTSNKTPTTSSDDSMTTTTIPTMSTSKEKDDNTRDDQRRLRTFMPLLEHYCYNCDPHSIKTARSILRLFRQMRRSTGTYIDCNAYATILASLARGQHFRIDAPPIYEHVNTDSTLSKLFNHCSGPSLLHELLSEMAEDVLELTPQSAEMISSAFQDGFDLSNDDILSKHQPVDDKSEDNDNDISWNITSSNLTIGRVDIPLTGACPLTGATLRLISLDEDQRQHVHATLLEMARQQSQDFRSNKKPPKNKKKKKQKKNDDGNNQPENERTDSKLDNPDHGYDELSRFSDWLDTREGKPFTAIVDGPNVAYFGDQFVHYSTLKVVVDALESMGETPLVTMPWKYVQPKFATSAPVMQDLSKKDLDLIERYKAEGKMYVVPRFCLDDYYWMIGSVSNQTVARNIGDLNVPTGEDSGRFAGMRPLLVTNDQMRDHRLDLLEPREFRRWCSCHIVKYNVTRYENDEWDDERSVFLSPADVFSREIQRNVHGSKNGAVWHFPVSEWDGPSWLCLWVNE